MHAPARPRRSALFLPASNARAIEKARTLPADVIILDLEDAVAPEAKEQARAAALEAVAQGFGAREVAVRANGLDTPWGAADMAALATSGVDAVLVPKVASAADIHACDAALVGAPAGLQLWAMIESCGAVLHLAELAATAADTRLALWVMGTNDLAKDMRVPAEAGRAPFLPFFSLAVAAARSAGLAILDGVCNAFRDTAQVSAEAAEARLYGFDGKTLIHPSQIAPANAAFAPSPAALARAQGIVEAFARAENAGLGAIPYEGAMVERLHLAEAEALLALATQIAALEAASA